MLETNVYSIYKTDSIFARYTFLIFLFAFLLFGCVDEVQRGVIKVPVVEKVATLEGAKYIPPQSAAVRTADLQPSFLNVPLKKQIQPAPIPDRLLVKIKPSEIANPFRPELIGCNAESLIEQGVLPGTVGLARIQYRGLTRNKKVTFSVHLSNPVMISELRAAFASTKGKILEPARVLSQSEWVSRVTVVVDPEYIEANWSDICRPNYFYLKKHSSLNPVFKKIGVVSMRRVFRSAEQPDPNRRGYFTVRKMKDLLQNAKNNHKVRAARAYQSIESAKLSSKISAPEDISKSKKWDLAKLRHDALLGDVVVEKSSRLEIPENMENWFILRMSPSTDLKIALKTLETLSVLQRATYDFPVRPTRPNDDEWDNQWGLSNNGTFNNDSGGLVGFDINIQDAWATSTPQQTNVIVAVIDDGFNENLIELRNRLWTNDQEIQHGRNGIDDDCNGYIDDIHGITTYDRFAIDYSASPACSVSPGTASAALGTHGTAVAGVIAAETDNAMGIAGTSGTDDVRLMNIALGIYSGRLWPPGFSEVAEGLMYAIAPYECPNGLRRCGADIVNMSFLANGCHYLMVETIYFALDAGLIIVASAGNDGVRFTITEELSLGVYPACLPGVIAVGGCSRDGLWWDSSNYGPGIDLVAPASEVKTISFDLNNPNQTDAEVITAGGTSLSAAFVSGGAAVVLGRFPQVTAPYMRLWLRAKARDITDPLGDGSNRPGDDEWTGAGMINVSEATTALLDIDDQPIIVEIFVERSPDKANAIGWLLPDRPLAVGGKPDLGIRVQGSSLLEWSLSYGIGDFPETWISIPVGDSTLTTREISANFNNVWDIQPGYNYLDTDPLDHGQLYTVRLEAKNKAGSEFTAYDYVVPTRAEILFPSKNWTLVPDWGWIPIGGFIDVRPSSLHTISIFDESNQLLWESEQLSFPHFSEAGYSTLAYALMGSKGLYGLPQFPPIITLQSEGWKYYQLTVQSSAGIEKDSVAFYMDDTHFPVDYWPLRHAPIQLETNYGYENLATYPLILLNRTHDILLINSDDSDSNPHLFFQTSKSVQALDRNGALIWEQRPLQGPPYHFYFKISYNMVIDNVDRTGGREIVYAVIERSGDNNKLRIFLLNAENGMPYNQNWPIEYVKPENSYIGYVGIGDVAGDNKKEIIYEEKRRFYYGIPDEDLAPAKLHVLDINGNELWRKDFPIEMSSIGKFELADIDDDEKQEILLMATGQILKGEDEFLVGWETSGNFQLVGIVQREGVDSPDVLVGSSGNLYLKSPTGVDRSGWPITESGYISVADIVTGGDEEVIVCGDTVRVFNTNGEPVSEVAEIELNGNCLGINVLDVDQDSENELVAYVCRFDDDLAANEREGCFLEAFDYDGTRLADSDNRWPIAVAFPQERLVAQLNRQVALGDVDGDGLQEVVQLLAAGAYGPERVYEAPSARMEILHLE